MSRLTPLVALLALVAGPGTLHAAQAEQGTVPAADSLPSGSVQALDGAAITSLPVDSVGGALLLLPGVGPARDGGLSLRGGAGGETATYLDGVPVSPGTRRMRLGIGPNALAEARVLQGPLPAWAGNAGAGVVALTTRRAGETMSGGIDFGTDRFAGASRLGLNRLGVSAAGPLSRAARFFLAGVTQGQTSAEFGRDARDAPIFVPAGTDTTVAVPATGGDPLSDTTYVDIPALAVFRGDCSAFESSVNPGIADNYGVDCRGDRTPASMRSFYQIGGGLDADAGSGARISVTAFRSRDQARRFDYELLYNPTALFAEQTRSAVYTAALGSIPGAARSWRLGLSRQSDRLLAGPLTAESEAETRNPSAGLFLSGFEFRHDLESFPIDSQLVTNYRRNTPGSRRSPYDLENTDQYRFTEQYRNNAYGVTGFVEGGGPLGAITLLEERRTIAFGDVSWAVSPRARVTIGGEYVRYGVDSYDHQLTSQAGSGIFSADPRRLGLFAEDVMDLGNIRLSLGLRYDRFDSRAARPHALDTIAFVPGTTTPSPTFGTYRYFPRVASYGLDATFVVDGRTLDLVSFIPDETHSAWSPRLTAEMPIGRGTVRAGYARHALVPDFAALFAGINTDLSITSPASAFGTDLGFARSSVMELGLRYEFAPGTMIDVSAYQRDTDGDPQSTILTAADPTRRNSSVDLRVIDDAGEARYRGLDARVEHRAGPLFGVFGYSFQHGRTTVGGDGSVLPAVSVRTANERPHALSAVLGFDAAQDPARRGPLTGSAAWITLRYLSGAPLAACQAGGTAPVGVPCVVADLLGPVFPSDAGSRLPSYRQIDLRLVRRLTSGRRAVSLYLDVRNLFNTRNLVRVFRSTGETDDPAVRDEYVALTLAATDAEAQRNGAANASGAVDLTFAGQGTAGCATWVSAGGAGLVPNCVALVRAEQRFGNGDGSYDLDEQRRAANAAFDARGEGGLAGAPRRMRLGIEVGF